ncbi:LexA family transcriptional regulator [Lactobacillus heilongjiangensis] [Lactiplantibacillus mudanjiangensis]|uniref:LexA family protein n=1 Tax=Lactiplantibacillus mudanjiangensis TaxID=1296538 RepID=UPI001015614C|nr:hypothetical protein [Lactiplantibacillus mudanjiangensis]VDG33356.1 LexA family transcriptional regulator [Lactobacillus heilongjiangensis] [Lactiplantibacillus mudanjiangensis]
MIRRKVTDLQILNCIYQYTVAFGWAPSIEEIGRKTGLTSKGTVFIRLEKLEEAGFIKRMKNTPRALSLTATGRELATGVRQSD